MQASFHTKFIPRSRLSLFFFSLFPSFPLLFTRKSKLQWGPRSSSAKKNSSNFKDNRARATLCCKMQLTAQGAIDNITTLWTKTCFLSKNQRSCSKIIFRGRNIYDCAKSTTLWRCSSSEKVYQTQRYKFPKLITPPTKTLVGRRGLVVTHWWCNNIFVIIDNSTNLKWADNCLINISKSNSIWVPFFLKSFLACCNFCSTP